VLEIVVPAVALTTIVFLLSLAVLLVRRGLVPGADVEILINDQRALRSDAGEKLLWALAAHDVYLPAACGGRGSCGQCRIEVTRGGGAITPAEENHIARRDAARGLRLACMVTLVDDVAVHLPAELLEIRRWSSKVLANRHVTTYLKELTFELPPGLEFNFNAGAYVQLEAPAGIVRFDGFDIAAEYDPEWQRHGLRDLAVDIPETTTRAYSLASHPGESGAIKLVVRIALPPPDAPVGTPPGRVSSYAFGLKPGDEVWLSGPFGEFRARDTDREMILIGGGAGIAPLRAIVLDQLLNKRSGRKISFWYGARNERELCYHSELTELARQHENFAYHVALSDPAPDSAWQGLTGLVHAVVYREYLEGHPSPEEAEYYLCGPPLMSSAVLAILEDLGVDRDSVFFDDFGS
jgi:Na+-transporting NADH:ubiquinone oxidoreductase subunit F